MKKSLFSVVFLFFLFSPVYLKAQLNHFIYLQTEGKLPFYAKLDKKLMSSSTSGYLIIPKLKDGTYNISVGFPKNENPEQNYVCTIDNKDAGYLIKNFGDKGWGLFNLQTLEIVMSGSSDKGKEIVKTEKTDAFSVMLSDVVNDPSIKETTSKVKEEPKPGPEKGTATQPGIKVAAAENMDAAKQEKAKLEQNQVEKTITRIKVTPDVDGLEMIYVDAANEKLDTIRVFIPAEKDNNSDVNATVIPGILIVSEENRKEATKSDSINEEDKQKPPGQDANSRISTADTVNKARAETKTGNDLPGEAVKNENSTGTKFLPIELTSSNKETIEKVNTNESPTNPAKPVDQEVTDHQVVSPTPMINSDCKGNATDEDFLKLRKKMASVEKEDEMIANAKKYFKTKCFTTDQIKNLSVLFLTDSGKYNFFDLAYQFVSDSHHFGTLESQLTDAYFISRFRAMIRH